MITAIISVGVLVAINLLMAAYTYGKLTQQVKDVCARVTRIENKVNGKVVKEVTE